MSDWNREDALEKKKAITRDGRLVINLKESVLDGKKVLTGAVATKKPPYKADEMVLLENHYWSSGGLGRHGGDDLLNFATKHRS